MESDDTQQQQETHAAAIEGVEHAKDEAKERRGSAASSNSSGTDVEENQGLVSKC